MPAPVADEVTSTGTSSPRRSRHCAAARSASSGGHEVGLRQRQQPRQRRQPRVVRAQLGLDRRVVGDRVGAVERREVEDVHEQARALDVGEEVVAEAGAVAGALDQPRDVGDDELAVGAVERAEHRLERRERVGGDLRRGPRHAPQQRGLAGVGQPDEADVGEQLQAQVDPALLAGQAALAHAAAPGSSSSRTSCCRARPSRRGRRRRAGRVRRGRACCRPTRRPACRAGRAPPAAGRRRRGAARPRRGRRAWPCSARCA